LVCDGFEKLLFENMSLSETKNIKISKDQMNNENFLQSNNIKNIPSLFVYVFLGTVNLRNYFRTFIHTHMFILMKLAMMH
jgi:hypothetical protein